MCNSNSITTAAQNDSNVLTGSEATERLRTHRLTTRCRRCDFVTQGEVLHAQDAGHIEIDTCNNCRDLPPEGIRVEQWKAIGSPSTYAPWPRCTLFMVPRDGADPTCVHCGKVAVTNEGDPQGFPSRWNLKGSVCHRCAMGLRAAKVSDPQHAGGAQDFTWNDWDRSFKDYLFEKYNGFLHDWRESRQHGKRKKAKRLRKAVKAIEPLAIDAESVDLIYPAEFGIHEEGINPPGKDDPSIRPYWDRFLRATPTRYEAWDKFLAEQRARSLSPASSYTASVAMLMAKEFMPVNFACVGPWQNFDGPPITMYGWYRHFQTYITCRWYDSPFPWACNDDELRGPNAFADEMDCLMSDAMWGHDFHLEKRVTQKYWREFLAEYPERVEQWQAFVGQQGRVTVLACSRETDR